jgi:hypothetical protein
MIILILKMRKLKFGEMKYLGDTNNMECSLSTCELRRNISFQNDAKFLVWATDWMVVPFIEMGFRGDGKVSL